MGKPLVLVYDSAQRRPPHIEEFLDVLRYRHLLVQLVSRNIKIRYKRSVLGFAWTMLTPLLMMLILTVVFSNLFRVTLEHYAVYLLSAIVLWTFFQQTSSGVMNEFIWGGSLLTRIHVPPAVFAGSALGTGLVNLVLSLLPLLLIMLLTGVPIRPPLLSIPLGILFASMFALGLGLILSRLAVLFGDVVHMWEVLLSAWYFLTPIIYPLDVISEQYRPFFYLNPMYYILEVFRLPIHAGQWPDLQTVGVAALTSAVTLLAGWWYFTRTSDEFAYRV